MKKIFVPLIVCIAVIFPYFTSAQLSTAEVGPGIWQTFGEPLNKSQYSILQGRLCNFLWKDIEPSNNVWNWDAFDKDLTDRTKDGLPVIFMVYTKEDAPDWIYTAGVSKVTEKDNKGRTVGYAPYYQDPEYKTFLKRMIQKVHAHVETLSPSVRNKIIGVQGCFGSTGDYIGYKGTVPTQYALDGIDFYNLFQEFSRYYYDEYKNTSPKIYLLSNPRNQGEDEAKWVVTNCPGWLKTGTIGKSYQLNDEADKFLWLYDILNAKTNGDYIRARSEMIGGNLQAPWWEKAPYKNMFAVMCYGIFWGLDWNNQAAAQLNDHKNDSAFAFFDRYTGQKDPSASTNAMCALKDALDASDGFRFPASTYGTVSRNNKQRYIKIADKYASYGALLEDAQTATLAEMENLAAKGTNDVGWRLVSGNYDRYLHQLIANETSAGYWNIKSSDVNTMYGRFGRGFDVTNNKKGLYFDVDNAFLSNAVLNGKYPVTIEITYLDKGTGGWQLYYDSQTGSDKSSVNITCNNTNLWKKATVTLSNAYFGNRGPNASDFSIRSTNTQNVIFSVIELSRPSNFASKKSKTGTASIENAVSLSSQNADIIAGTQSANKLIVNPNPVQGQFYVEVQNKAPIEQVILYNQSGKIILQKKGAGSRFTISRSELGSAASGIYYIKIITAHAVLTSKVVLL